MKCPCSSTLAYTDCCGAIIDGHRNATTAEELMRSRYSAYTQANIDYITKSMREAALTNFDPTDAKQWAQSVQWLDLTIVDKQAGVENDTDGVVEFIARFSDETGIQSIHERSQFKKIEGVWYYTSGEHQKTTTKIGRNDPCPCNSDKKYKKCCGT